MPLFERVEIGPHVLYRGDCLEVLPTLSRVDAVVTDPPYGCDKAEWDGLFFGEWYPIAKRFGCPVYIITGSAGVKDAIRLVGEDFIDVIAARNLNGMTRGPIGFGNWLSCVVACGKPSRGQNAFDFSVSGKMPDHPSPKPISYMRKLIARITEEGDAVCDPMMGSGTTAAACERLGRRFIGIEKEPKYFDIACKRIQEAMKAEPLLEACA